MCLIIDHCNALLCHSGKRSSKSGKAICYRCVVLDILISVIVRSQLIRILSAKHISYKSCNHLTSLFFISILLIQSTVDLGMTGRIRLSLCCQVIPVLSDLSVFIKAENVKCYLLACAGEVVNRLQKYLVSVLKCTDVLNGGLYGSGCKICNASNECLCAGPIGQVVLDIAGRQKFLGFFGISACESVDECECFFLVRHDRVLLHSDRIQIVCS